MVEILKTVSLKTTGEQLTIKKITAPDIEYADRLYHFLDHKSDNTLRDLRQKLRGDYKEECIDNFFIGEINDKIAGQLWYGYPINRSVGNFGHVYTALEHRKKGITNELMKYFIEDFNACNVKALLCGTGSAWIAKIYLDFGFVTVVPGTDHGPLVLLKKEAGKSFTEFAAKYYSPGSAIAAHRGTSVYKYEIDKMLANIFLLNGIVMHRIMAAAPLSYQEALFMAEDQKGIITAAEAENSAIPGWAYILNTGSLMENESPVFDFFLHPAYLSQAKQFTEKSLHLAAAKGIKNVYSWFPAVEELKISVCRELGFSEAACIRGYCLIQGKNFNLYILKKCLD
ncbi:MAG: hypothetical protein A2096_03000 [Spirochaetes bacterium GWF1_41_5]|nr:MAG: hypothetical protein A2096_03000 [Spirochaetes bacterium GWF1_41_5]HBE02209.1 hypothetical protein [Spirochaetia bacterium]